MNTSNVHNLAKSGAAKPIFSISPFTLLDYPDKTACILWFAGCNMRCLYCYNPEIVLGKGKICFEEALKFIKTRVNLLDGVVLSGGECTLHRHIIEFIRDIKSMGLLVKIDTNGTNPRLMEYLIEQKLIDYVALDFKAPPQKFETITKSDFYEEFLITLQLLINHRFSFEVRTTFHSSLLNQNDIQFMVDVLESNYYQGVYYIQNYLDGTETLSPLGSSAKNQLIIGNLQTPLTVILRN